MNVELIFGISVRSSILLSRGRIAAIVLVVILALSFDELHKVIASKPRSNSNANVNVFQTPKHDIPF